MQGSTSIGEKEGNEGGRETARKSLRRNQTRLKNTFLYMHKLFWLSQFM
jgi:hypothetical protein